MDKRGIISKIRTKFRKRHPLNITAVKRDDPELMAAAYAGSPFLGWRQALQEAGTDYGRINIELEEYVECPICRIERVSLIAHIMKNHGMRMEEYREAYPDAPAISQRVQSAAMNRSNSVRICPHWEPLWSPEYVLDRLFFLRSEGHPINYQYLEDHENSLVVKAIEYFGHLDKAFLRLGLDPREVRVRVYWTPEEIEHLIRGIISADHFPGMEYLASILFENHGGLYVACLRNFGSVDEMVRALGISEEPASRKPRRKKPEIQGLWLVTLPRRGAPWRNRAE